MTNSKTGKVKLELQAEDAYKMQVSNSENFDGAKWERYTKERMWILLADEDGKKTVYVRFSDRVENISETISTSIIIDTTPPSGSIQINDDAIFAYSTDVKLKLTSEDSDGAVYRQLRDLMQSFPRIAS